MRLLKKLFEMLLTLCILGALVGGIWYFYGDYIASQVKYLLQIAGTLKEDREYSEQTAEMKDILENTYTNFSNENLVECKTYEIYSGKDEEDAYENYNVVAWDKSQDYIRKTYYDYFYVQTFIQGPYNAATYLSDCWTYFGTANSQNYDYQIMHCSTIDESESYSVQLENWYYHQLPYHPMFREGEYSDLMPHALLRELELKDYEEVGMEDFEGKQAMHYIVTHKPLQRRAGVVMEEQYDIINEDGSVTKCAPIEYFETIIDTRVKEAYPEFYASFMELVDKRYYQDNQTHFWIAEDGTLLGIESDCTFERYDGTLLYDDPETICAAIEENGDFARLSPVSRVAIFQYGDEVEPVTIPEEYISLAE